MCDHLLHNGSVRLDFMTDDVNEAEETRILAPIFWPAIKKGSISWPPVFPLLAAGLKIDCTCGWSDRSRYGMT